MPNSAHDTRRRPRPQAKRLPFRERARRSANARVGVLLRGHRIWQVVLDAMLVASAYWLAFYIRFDNGTPAYYERTMFETIGFVVAIKIGVFIVTGMYVKWWRYLTVKDMESVMRSVVLASVVALAYVYLVRPLDYVVIPRSVAVLDFGFTLFLIAGVRLLARSAFERPALLASRGSTDGTRVLVVGAGEAGRVLIRELQRANLDMVAVGLVDDDERKQHMRLDGVPVLGTTLQLKEVITDSGAEEVVIAMPSASGEVLQRIINTCRERNLPCRILPALNELVLGETSNLAARLREVSVEDVLGRDPISVDVHQIAAYVRDQVVLVTGAGGSIGSELCRQLARVNPRQLILVDQSEHHLFEIEQELILERDYRAIVPVLADVKDYDRMRKLFELHSPKVVFHAAAYKHVPMLEENPVEAIRNNALGTRTVCEIAERTGVDRFVLVSTDKAVAPRTVMGQSKALAEWIVQGFAERSFHTRYMAVRFGNVLGSSGSVVPIFKRQIERGGPVRVTDERMTRFFMTIPEAVQLIIQAGALGDGGEVFVLDMGKPVRIVDLANNMIELAGLRPGIDIDVEIVGIRPGEKLHEELFAGDELPARTSHGKIWRSTTANIPDADRLLEELDELQHMVDDPASSVTEITNRLTTLIRPRIDAGSNRQLPTT